MRLIPHNPVGNTGLDIQSLTGKAVTIEVVASQEKNNAIVAETTANFGGW